MAQYDSLHTGNSGVYQTFGNELVSDIVEEEVSEQKRELEQLLPSVRQILDVIDDEITAISDIRSYMKVLPDAPSKVDIEAEYRGRELYIRFLNTMKSNITERVGDALEER